MLKSTNTMPVFISVDNFLLIFQLFRTFQLIKCSVVLFVNKTMLLMDEFQMWDAGTGQGFSQYAEHQKRAWSVDFSRADPTMFASGSDDCSVKLWSVNDVCCLFSSFNFGFSLLTVT